MRFGRAIVRCGVVVKSRGGQLAVDVGVVESDVQVEGSFAGGGEAGTAEASVHARMSM